MPIRGDQARNLPSHITQHWLNRAELSARLLRITDLGLMAMVFLAPLFMGGRHPFGRFVFIALASFTAMTWMLRACLRSEGQFRISGAEWLLLGAVLIISFQLLPLPQGPLRHLP